ncbi:hypothetical protein ABIC63_002017 [Pseudacidovorax sp. 1753]
MATRFLHTLSARHRAQAVGMQPAAAAKAKKVQLI